MKSFKFKKPALGLRTCNADLTSHDGFQWPEKGGVKAPDWKAEAECGNGLHALAWGEGDGNLLNWGNDAKWLVVEFEESKSIDLVGKVKFPCTNVLFVGDRVKATEFLLLRAPGRKIVGATVSAGYCGTATAGDKGTATAGDYGTATAGYCGTATAGDYGTATAGNEGTISILWWDKVKEKYRVAIGEVGENGIKPNTPYVVKDGKLKVKE